MCSGVEAHLVEVEARISRGKERFEVIGLGDVAVREARDRVRSALSGLGIAFPKRVLINLAPADVRKEGSGLDLPICVAILAAKGIIPARALTGAQVHGELALDGRLKALRGTALFAAQASRAGRSTVVLPRSNSREAQLIPGIDVIGCRELFEVVAFFRDGVVPEQPQAVPGSCSSIDLGFSEVVGQLRAKRALEIAAAGGHNVLFIGPPGCGKSMLAEKFPSILPRLNDEELLEAVAIHSVAGASIDRVLQGIPPFRAPHHSVSEAGLVGGGTWPRPGEVSLAHRGVLFLDEFPEFRRPAIEALRAPIESGSILVSRAKGATRFPAAFQLIAAMNPCPCGRLGVRDVECLCSRAEIARYLQRLSQPMLDRIDLQVELEPVSLDRMMQGGQGRDDDAQIRERVVVARGRAFEDRGLKNSMLPPATLRTELVMSKGASTLLETIASNNVVSARRFFRVLRVARTIADLDGADMIDENHLAESYSFRGLAKLTNMAANQSFA